MIGVSLLMSSVTFKLNKLRAFSKDGAEIPVSYSCSQKFWFYGEPSEYDILSDLGLMVGKYHLLMAD